MSTQNETHIRRRLLRRALLAATATAIASPSRASDTQSIAATSPAFGALPVVEARILFVSFPSDGLAESPDSTLVPWAGWLADELRDFAAVMSRGKQRLNVELVARPAPASGLAWRAAHPASWYRNDADPCPCTTNRPCAGCTLRPTYATLNNEIMTAVHTAYVSAGIAKDYWEPVNMVFVIPYESPFSSPTLGGIARLGSSHVEGAVPLDVPGFKECITPGCGAKRGVTQRLFPSDFNDLPYNHRVAGGAAHEYGHVLTGRNHAPRSGNPPPGPMPACGEPEPDSYVNTGWYDMMRGFGDSRWTHVGVVPMHPRWLDQPAFEWVPTETITESVRGLRVPQIRAPDAKCFEIVTTHGATTQSFLFANYQGAASSRFDAKLGGKGLLVWHVLATAREPPFLTPPVDQAWDLESAAGKVPGRGRDALEANWCALGSAADYFGDHPGAGGADFSAITDPNTNLYPSLQKSAPQSIPSSIAIENIRADPTPGSTAMLVDVYLDPRQYVLAPNGRDVVQCGRPIGVVWAVRPHAGIRDVDVEWSRDGGQSFEVVARRQPNRGWYIFTPLDPCDHCRVRITSWDGRRSGSDESDADFVVQDAAASAPRTPPALFVHAAPNPFNPATRIVFGVDRHAPVRLAIYDMRGREVRRLVDETLAPDTYERVWNGCDAAGQATGAGVFAYRLTVGDSRLQGKLVLVK